MNRISKELLKIAKEIKADTKKKVGELLIVMLYEADWQYMGISKEIAQKIFIDASPERMAEIFRESVRGGADMGIWQRWWYGFDASYQLHEKEEEDEQSLTDEERFILGLDVGATDIVEQEDIVKHGSIPNEVTISNGVLTTPQYYLDFYGTRGSDYECGWFCRKYDVYKIGKRYQFVRK